MRGRQHLTRVGTALSVLAVLVLAVVESPHVALELAPAFVLALFLIVGIFPGEQAIARARARRNPSRPRRASPALEAPATPSFVRVAGVTLAFALAMRPPPGVAAGTR